MPDTLRTIVGRCCLIRFAAVALALFVLPLPLAAQEDQLPSWNSGAAKSAILDFVAQTTNEDSANFVAPANRVATFDQDGTLWVEQPLYGQGLFALDRLAAMAQFSEKDWMEICAPTRSGSTSSLAAGRRLCGFMRTRSTVSHPNGSSIQASLPGTR